LEKKKRTYAVRFYDDLSNGLDSTKESISNTIRSIYIGFDERIKLLKLEDTLRVVARIAKFLK
jgi:hypothetical protein